jgi:hypothetical protein
MGFESVVRPNALATDYHRLLGRSADVEDALRPRFPCVFTEERWLLPEMQGSGCAEQARTIWSDNHLPGCGDGFPVG